MDTSFQKLQIQDEKFQEYLSRGHGIFEEFKEFVRLETLEYGKVQKRTDKPRSYFVFLIRLIYAYELYYGNSIGNFNDMSCFKQLNEFIKLPEMHAFNRKKNNFYSAALTAFYRFLLGYLEADYVDISRSDINFLADLNKYDDTKPIKVECNGRFIYPRNPRVSFEAKQVAHWKCEIDSQHNTFISEFDGNQYMEAHHLIPMAVQDLFDKSLDFSGNVISLCPVCHRKIHHSIASDKKEMIKILFKQRKKVYDEKGVHITLNELYKYYGI